MLHRTLPSFTPGRPQRLPRSESLALWALPVERWARVHNNNPLTMLWHTKSTTNSTTTASTSATSPNHAWHTTLFLVESLLDTAQQYKERKAKPGSRQRPLSRWFTPKFPAPTLPPNITFSIHTNRDPNICKTWNKLQDEQKQLFGTQQFYQLQKTFHFPKKSCYWLFAFL